MTTTTHTASWTVTLRDILALTKPRITAMVLVTAAGGIWLAPGAIDAKVALVMLATTAMVVGAANALNCYLERDSDRLMARTMRRPLPDGRLEPRLALWFGVLMGVVSVPLLALTVNPLTGLLGLLALVSYVVIYTPMKPWSPAALLVGAVPGALPPLMGWTAVTGGLDLPGLVLFGVMFFWQIPHFIAISIFRQSEYEAAGLKVLPSVRGVRHAKREAVVYTVALVATSLWLYALGVAGWAYGVAAALLGAWFLAVALRGLWTAPENDERWAKKLFVTSLMYLTVLFAVLIANAA